MLISKAFPSISSGHFQSASETYYCSIALQMEHCFFGNNIKSKMGILNLIPIIYFNQKTPTKIFFFKFI